MKNEWIVIEIDLPGSSIEIAGALLAEFGCSGTLVEERQLDTFIVPEAELEADRIYRIKAYFADVGTAEAIRETIINTFQAIPECAEQLIVGTPVKVRNEDWAENWKQNFPRQRIGARLVIRPSWENYTPAENEVVIELDPGMAFGTGTHGTTLLCLEMIAELLAQPSPPASFLDVGTGSGILALGAAALGCPLILANDIDPDACLVARENAQKNDLTDRIEITSLPLEQLSGSFELVVANILAEENVRLKNELLRHLAPGGWLVLSGILREKEKLVRTGFADLPLDSFPSRYQDDWTCLVFRRRE
jgi:ribosomal protein L11 methyltransferase